MTSDYWEDTDGTGVAVAVADSGWARLVPESRVGRGIGLVDPDNDLRVTVSEDDDDRVGHGTACADLVLRCAPGTHIVPVRVFGHRLETSVGTLVAALDWTRARGIRLINMSVGTSRMQDAVPLYEACERFRSVGGVIVAAHPRAGPGSLPAEFDNVISVGASRLNDGLRVTGDPCVDVVTQGQHADVRWCDGHRRTVHGSSFAAPLVTGMVARLLERHQDVGIDEVRSFLARRSDDLHLWLAGTGPQALGDSARSRRRD